MSALFGFTGPFDETLFDHMSGALRHRGSDHVARVSSPHATLAVSSHFSEKHLGCGCFQSGDLTLALSGEIRDPVPHPNVLPQLAQQFLREGTTLFPKMRGSFTLAILQHETLFLVRDAAGERTLYHGSHSRRFRFAAEPKGIYADPAFPRRLRPAAVAQYLTFSFIPLERTMLEDINEIPAGHFLQHGTRQAPTLTSYFPFENTPASDIDPREWPAVFRKTFNDAVSQRLQPPGNVGIFLSGGIDSSIVAAEVARQRGPGVKSFALHFGLRRPNELTFARAVAERCQLDHEEVEIQPKKALPSLREMLWRLDEPIGDPITMPNYLLSRRVAHNTLRVFNGEGGDPLFGGPKNIPMMLQHYYGHASADTSQREQWYLASFQRCYDDLHRLLDPAFQSLIQPERDLEGILHPFLRNHEVPSFLHRLIATNIRLKGAHLILPKVERMTAAGNLQVQSPLFDDTLIKLSFSMPPSMKLNRGVEKWILKEAFRKELPEAVIQRPKSGMRVPVHYWFKGELKRYARHILSRPRLKKAGIFNPDRVQQLLRYDTDEGRGRYGLRIWMLITFEIWRRLVIEKESL